MNSVGTGCQAAQERSIPMSQDWQKIIYISGSNSGETEWEQACNISHAGYIARELWKRGWVVICPQKNTAFFKGICSNKEMDDRVWLKGNMELLSRCDAIYILNTAEHSHNSYLEYCEAMGWDMPIYFESEGDLLG